MRVPGQRRSLELQAASRAWCGRTTLVCVLLAVTTLGVYWPVIFNAFTNYDDGYYVTENSHVQRGLSWEGLVWAFGSLHGEHTYWHPLTWVSHMVDCEVFGLKAWGHHLVNLLFHTLNTVLVFLVFRRMTGSFWRCAVLAGLFALHPLQVDTVAWVAERKNLLSALFWLLAMWAYVGYAEVRRKKEEGRMQNAESGITFHASRITLLSSLPLLLHPRSDVQAGIGDPAVCALVARLLAAAPVPTQHSTLNI